MMKKGYHVPAQAFEIEVSVVLFLADHTLAKLPHDFKIDHDRASICINYSIGPFEFPELTEDESQPGDDSFRFEMNPGVWKKKLEPVWRKAYAEAKRRAAELAPAFPGWKITSISLSAKGEIQNIIAASTFDSQSMGEKPPILTF